MQAAGTARASLQDRSVTTSSAGRAVGSWRERTDGPLRVVLLAMLLSGVLAIILSRSVFSHLSVNDDESVYLLQAHALAHGDLFPRPRILHRHSSHG